MQNVVFVNALNQPLANGSTDVPRNGEQVIIGNQGFVVAAVRYYVYQGGVVHAVVVLQPITSEAAVLEHYQKLAVENVR
jgi:hypothetical protein